ncbi:fibronectin type III domain-containing protein [Cystobacter fuscus]
MFRSLVSVQKVIAGTLAFSLGCGVGPSPGMEEEIGSATESTQGLGATERALASDRAYQWLKAQQDLTNGSALSGLVDSFDDWWNATERKQIVYTYDQAVAAIAFMAKGDRVRAEKVLDKLVAIQDPDGSWINSYWWNGYGEEIRKHVGPVAWVTMAFMTHEKLYGSTTYRTPARKALEWMLTFKKPNGAISGGRTTWDIQGVWTDEVWSSTEHNEDVYNLYRYYAGKFSDRATAYNDAAQGVKQFLDNVMWNNTTKRFYGGWKNNTGLLDANVPLDVNPWGVLALGLSGTRDYKASLASVDNARGVGTVADPRYVHSLPYENTTITAYDFDWQYDCAAATDQNGNYNGDRCADIWFEGSAFMSVAHYMNGNTAKADSIIDEIIKKQGTSGSLLGGVPYSLKGTSNNYWRMAQENCVSSTGWLILAIHRFNPFTGSVVNGGGGNTTDTQAPSAPSSLKVSSTTSSSVTLSWTGSTDNVGVASYDVYQGSTLVGSSSATTFTVSGLSASTTYSFSIKARDAAGNTSTASNTVSATTSASGTGDGHTTADYTANVTRTSSTQARISFKPTTSALYVDVHYTLNGGGQQNFRMALANGTWTQDVAGLSTGSRLEYWFTYEKSGPQYDSPHYTYTH